MSEKRLTELFARYTSGESSEKEEQEFMELAALPEYKDLLEGMIQELFIQTPGIRTMNEDTTRNTLQAIFQSTGAPVIAMRKKRYWQAAAAAVILLITGTAAYLFFNHNPLKKPVETEIAINQDLPAPKSAHASITLAGGRQIMLDSIASGRITTQGSVNLSKLADGGITYNGKEQSNTALLYNTLSNPRGSRVINMELADGSRVWLNAGSSVTYPVYFTGKERKVSITGEAYFEIAHDASKPFIVSKAETSVTVLGTHFNVNAYDDEETIRVTLLEGSVKMSIANGEWSILKPGEQALASAHSPLIIDHSPNLEEVMAWKNGWFRFSRTDLQNIMRQLSRWYGVDIAYEGPLKARSFSGIVSRESNISQVLKVMQQAGIRFRMEENKIIVIQ